MKYEYNVMVLKHMDSPKPPPSATIVGGKWVFRNKYNDDESLQRHKERLVAKEFHQ